MVGGFEEWQLISKRNIYSFFYVLNYEDPTCKDFFSCHDILCHLEFQLIDVSFIWAKFCFTTTLQSTFILLWYFVGVSFYCRPIWAYSQTRTYSLYMLFYFL